MREVSSEEYLEFVSKHNEVVVEDQVIKLKPIEVERLEPVSDELTDVSTTVWSYPKRGSWATHKGNYRGNWAPQIPRALTLMYTKKGDTILDPMIGSGTTCIEAKLLGRNCIGVDINYNAVILTLHRLYWLEEGIKRLARSMLVPYAVNGVTLDDVIRASVHIYHGDARELDLIKDGSVDAVFTHPPYWNIIEYKGSECNPGDLSCARSLEDYLKLMVGVSREIYSVLKPGGYAAILIGDTRIHKHYVPISHRVLDVFLDAGFILKEEVIKVQHRMKTTREVWQKLKDKGFLLIYHEKLFIFRKPEAGESLRNVKYSTKYS
ncbi:DNA methyltransferase [Acidilobus sp.]|uniref:DNA methyltransferase n=1 Tax=Acidilobus sp. TaxID=1872109 RepID=UPI003CFD7EF7